MTSLGVESSVAILKESDSLRIDWTGTAWLTFDATIAGAPFNMGSNDGSNFAINCAIISEAFGSAKIEATLDWIKASVFVEAGGGFGKSEKSLLFGVFSTFGSSDQFEKEGVGGIFESGHADWIGALLEVNCGCLEFRNDGKYGVSAKNGIPLGYRNEKSGTTPPLGSGSKNPPLNRSIGINGFDPPKNPGRYCG